jgi:hypothetical protein
MLDLYYKLIKSFIEFRAFSVDSANNYIVRLSSQLLIKDDDGLNIQKISGVTYNYSRMKSFGIGLFKYLFSFEKPFRSNMSGIADFSVVCLDSSRMSLDYNSTETLREDLIKSLAGINSSKSYLIILNEISQKPLFILDMQPTQVVDKETLSRLAEKSIYLADEKYIIQSVISGAFTKVESFIKIFRSVTDSSGYLVQKVYSLLVFLGFREVFKDLKYNSYMLTSNSFLAECFRFYSIADNACNSLLEFSHGINSLVVNDYIKSIQHHELAYAGTIKLRFIEQLPDLPHWGVKSPNLAFDNSVAVNVGFNKFFSRFDYDLALLVKFILSELEASAVTRHSSESHVYLAIVGYSDFQSDHTGLDSFMIELYLVDQVKLILGLQDIDCTILYSCHPAADYNTLKSDQRLIDREIKVVRNTWATHFYCDVSIGLFSAAVYEAEFVGSKGYQPMVPADGLHSAEYLQLITSPSDEGATHIYSSLEKLLQSCQPLTDDKRKIVVKNRLENLKHKI